MDFIGLGVLLVCALLFQVGALVGDAIWASAALSGVVIIRPWAVLNAVLGIGGALLLGALAFIALRDCMRGHAPVVLHTSRHDDLLLSTLLSLANPFAVVFWLSVGRDLLRVGALAPLLPTVATAVGAIILATLIWSVLLASLASYGPLACHGNRLVLAQRRHGRVHGAVRGRSDLANAGGALSHATRRQIVGSLSPPMRT